MHLAAIVFGAYFVIGFIVACAITLTDAAKNRISGIGLLGGIATLHSVGFLIFVCLWPLWLGILWLGVKEENQEKPEIKGIVESHSRIPAKNDENEA